MTGHPVAGAVWTRHDTTTAPSPAFIVARTHAVVTVSLAHTGELQVAVRRAGEVAPASSPVRVMVGLDLHPWVGPHTAHRLAERIANDRTADTLGHGNLTETVQMLVHRSAMRDYRPDPTIAALIMSIITPTSHGHDDTPGLSDRSIRRLVRSATDLTPIRLRRTARAASARRLLQSTAHSLADIAQVVGYSDQSHMTHDFKALCGYTPGQWRLHTTSWSCAADVALAGNPSSCGAPRRRRAPVGSHPERPGG